MKFNSSTTKSLPPQAVRDVVERVENILFSNRQTPITKHGERV